MNPAESSTDRQWILATLYAASVAGYPLIAGVPVALALDSRAISIPYRAIILGLSIGVIIRSARQRRLYTGILWLPLGIFWTLYLARMLSDTFMVPVPLGQPPLEYFLYGVGTCLIPMMACLARISDSTLRLALHLTTAGGAVALLATVYLGTQALLAGNLAGVESGRFELWTLNPISLGHLGVSVATLALFQLRTEWRRFSAVPLLVAAGLGFFCTGVAASKAPLLALGINLSFLLFLDWRDGHRVRAIIGAVALPILALQAALYLEADLGFEIVSRVQMAFDDPARFDLMTGARDQFLASPFLGSSLDERGSLGYPHNTFLESFMAVGIVGGLAYTFFHLAAVRRSLHLLTARPQAAWIGILAVQYTISALFSGSVYFSNTMWGLLAAAIAADSTATPVGDVSESIVLVTPPTTGTAS